MVMVMAIACLGYIGPTRGLGTQGVYLEELYKWAATIYNHFFAQRAASERTNAI